MGELDKMLIQDFLTERTRIRTAIHTDIRIIGVGVVAVLGVAWNTKVTVPVPMNIEQAALWSASWVLVLVVLGVLSVLFMSHLNSLAKQLKNVNSDLAARLKPYGEVLPEDYMVSRANAGVISGFFFLVLILLCFWCFSEYNRRALGFLQSQHKIGKSNTSGNSFPTLQSPVGSKPKVP